MPTLKVQWNETAVHRKRKISALSSSVCYSSLRIGEAMRTSNQTRALSAK